VFVVVGILFALAPSASGGSTNWEVVAPGVTVAQTQDALTPLGFGSLTISVLGTGSKQTLHVGGKLALSTTQDSKVAGVLAGLARKPPSSVSILEVGPIQGSDTTNHVAGALGIGGVLLAGLSFLPRRRALATKPLVLSRL
jgi:hypothetical protein